MNRTRTILLTSAVGATLVAGLAGVAAASSLDGADDDAGDTPISGDALTEASRVALAHTGGGEVTGTEIGDEDSYYEVEVTLDDGRQVDVQLDEQFQVVGSEPDDESGSDR